MKTGTQPCLLRIGYKPNNLENKTLNAQPHVTKLSPNLETNKTDCFFYL